jgi:flagellar biosynthesis protein
VTALGRGLLAERLIEEARQHGIPIRENPDLVQILLELDLGQEIPPDLYQAVAEILIFVYRLNEDWKRNHSS